MKKINDIVGYDKLKIVQDDKYFQLSLESVLLPNFVSIKKTDKKAIDFGCGNAPIPIILNYLYPDLDITGIELQEEILELAKESLKINKLEEKIKLYNMNIKDVKENFKSESFDIVTSNPPYFKIRKLQQQNDEKVKSIARHELEINLDDIVKNAFYLLKNKGKLVMVHRTERFTEVIEAFTKNKIEPKRVRFIYPKAKSESNLFLIEGIKNTGSAIKVEKPLVIHNEDGTYTEEVNNIFCR